MRVSMCRLMVGAGLLVLFFGSQSLGRSRPLRIPPGEPLDSEGAAQLPLPGTAAPTSIGFSPDGASITYLLPEGAGLEQALWIRGVEPTSESRVVARASDLEGGSGPQSAEEALRRERQRQLATGISQLARSAKDGSIVTPLGGDLYLIRPDRPAERISRSAEAELDPQFSPDGSRVAFARGGELHVLELSDGSTRKLSPAASPGISYATAEFMAQEELDRSTGFWWSTDGARIAYQRTDERSIPEFLIVDQGNEVVGAERHRYPFAGADNARISLGVVSAEGGETQWLSIAAAGEDVYLARVDWEDPTHLLVQVLSRDQKSLRLERIDVVSGKRTRVIEERAPDWVNLHDDLRVVPTTGELLWSTETTGFRHLVLHGPSGERIRTLTSGEWAVDEVVHLDAERREVWFLSNRDDPRQKHLERVSLEGGPVTRMSTTPGTHRAAVAPDGSKFVLTSSSLAQPPITTLRDRDGRELATLHDAQADPRLGRIELPAPETAEFRATDGTALFGLYYAPRDRSDPKSAPLVVYVYGGPHVQRVVDDWTATADPVAQLLAARGIAVWVVDNRGASRRGHAFEAALNRSMGEIEVRDQVDGVRFATSRWPVIDPERVGITGASYGGYMTLRALQLAPDVFRAGVARAPVTDWDGYDTAYTERYMGTPSDNSAGYLDASVLRRADRLQGELLIVHGLLDENVHFRHSARLAAALMKAGKPFELLPIPDERHGIRKPENRRYFYDRMVSFFERALAR